MVRTTTRPALLGQYIFGFLVNLYSIVLNSRCKLCTPMPWWLWLGCFGDMGAYLARLELKLLVERST
jgi:hypothetical protein